MCCVFFLTAKLWRSKRNEAHRGAKKRRRWECRNNKNIVYGFVFEMLMHFGTVNKIQVKNRSMRNFAESQPKHGNGTKLTIMICLIAVVKNRSQHPCNCLIPNRRYTNIYDVVRCLHICVCTAVLRKNLSKWKKTRTEWKENEAIH